MDKIDDLPDAPETIEIVSPQPDPPSRWVPVVSSETLEFLEYLAQQGIPADDRESLKNEAISVLARCVPPTDSNNTDTGLVIGYVQSGKTMSFTTVAALARDNGYKLIIVITGITRNLFQQSTDRIEGDLRLRSRHDRKWQFLPNPKSRPDVRQRIVTALESSESAYGLGRQTVLITVMKNRTHLDHLINLLRDVDLSSVPALIVDDEADQASLNNQVRHGAQSATYRRIAELRRLLPHHTFLQYTATPQALLLINLIDVLSPSFAEVLTAGRAYTGGRVFFESDFRLVRRIPTTDIPTKSYPLIEPPDSLLEAMKIFFLGVAADLKQHGQDNRSMMVHPSKETMQHANYAHWVRQIQQRWQRTLALGSQDPDRLELLEDFERAYSDLSDTVKMIASFDDLVEFLLDTVKMSIVTEVNAARGPTPQVDWHQNYAHIVVGGDVLNRGVTIKGLTVTYMPRSRGVGNADTIEQRARWFGYKADYLGFCRIYLADESLLAYRSYVSHEENIRKQMRDNRASAKSLREWRRAFFLDHNLRPTRADVLDLDYARGNFANTWYQTHAPHDSDEAVRSNRVLIGQMRERLSFQQDRGHEQRTDIQKHLVASSGLASIYSEFLTKIRVTRPGDSQRLTGLLLQIGRHLELHPDEQCAIYIMSGGTPRERGVDENDEISKLFEGEAPTLPIEKRGHIYPGDRRIRVSQGLTIQIHILNLVTGKGSGRRSVAQGVPAFAIWVPRSMSADWLVQEQSQPQ